MSLKTYGDRPVSFQLEDGGEYYCIGSEVSAFVMAAAALAGQALRPRNLMFLMIFRWETISGCSVVYCTKNTPE